MKNLKYIIISIALVLASVFTNAQTVYTVTKTTDPDPFEHPFNNDDNLCAPEMYGTLQWAINKVNANTGESVIEFNIPGNGVHEIVLNSYLPQIINPVTIDGTSQDGYTQGNPRIRIDGDLLVEQACFSAYNSSLNIEGIWFNNFTYNVINLSAVAESEIKNLLITNNNITDTYSFVFSLDECNNIRFYNNIIEDEQDNVDARNYSFGYYLKSSNNIIIGGTEEGQGNTIKNCNIALYLVVSQQIKISGNKIYNNNVAMTYLYGSNNYIEKPVVSAYTGDVLSGTALPNSTIEVFGSTGEENANEYLVSTVSDVNGDWSVEVSDTEYEHYLVTQTDENNNTSTFGNVIYPDCEVPTNLSASEGISTSHTLSWSGQAGATYNVSVGRHGEDDENWFVSFTPYITENYLTISGLDENTVYEFLVNANCGTAESEWAGPYVFNEEIETHNNCSNALFVKSDTLSNQQIVSISDDEFWLKFIALTDTCFIEINTVIPNLWEIEEVFLYTGECNNLTLIQNFTVTQNDSTGIYLHNFNMIPNQNYYLRVIQNHNSVSIDYLINIILQKDSFCDDENIQCFVCDNLVPNNSFEIYGSNYTQEFSFTYGFVCCNWQTAFGSPQIKEGEIAGTNSAYMWLSNHASSDPEDICIGEGIFVNIEGIESDEEYLLNFKYKVITNYGIEYDVPYSELRVLLTNENTFNVDMQHYGSTVPQYDDFNNTDYQILFDNPQIVDDNWIDVSVSFTADDNFETLLIYPHFNSDYLDWIIEENLSVTGFYIEEISIYPDPVFELYEDTFCNNETEVQLEANPADGTWSGMGVLSPNGLFNPSLFVAGETSVYYTYSYLDDNNIECEVFTEFQIHILPGPNPPFFEVQECLYWGGNTNFEFEDLNNPEDSQLEWTWEIGNEVIVEGQSISYSFSDYGYYCINVDVSSEQCGTNSYSDIVYVNNNICACDVSDEGYYDYNYTHGYTISSNNNETWSSTETLYVEGDIYIQANAILTIGENTRIEFVPNGRIIVEAGGKLIIEENVTLSSIYFPPWAQQTIDGDKVIFICPNNMWQGIEVWGDDEFPNLMDMQGIVEIIDKNNVVIENAHIGILSGARNMDHLCNSEANPDPFDSEKGCGLIHIVAGNTLFRNNGIGIKLLPREPLISIGAFWSGNLLQNCIFESTQYLLDTRYSATSTSPYPNQQNPWAGYANEYSRTDVGIYINGIKGLDISSCTFDNMQYGILSYDSKFNVQNNSHFTNMIFGIRCENTYNSIINNHEISQCFFDEIPNYISAGTVPDTEPETAAIFIKAGYNDYIHNNTFGDFLTNQKLNHFGIVTSNSSTFEITENVFRKFNQGVLTKNTGINGGFIGAESNSISNWNGNRFTHSWRSITTQGYNPKLRLKCNTSVNNDENIDEYDVNYLNTGTLANQGLPSPMGGATQKQRYPAGNEFFPDLIDYYKRISSTDPYQYYYYRHSGPEAVIPYIDEYNEALIHVNSTNAILKISNASACPDPFWGHIVIGEEILLPQLDITPTNQIITYPFSIVDSLQYASDSLSLVRVDLIQNLDNGKTIELLNDIYGNTNQGRLKNKLISCSPLSDTVLYALMSEYPLSHGNFKNVMLLNLPVNQNLEYLLYTILTQIPSGIAKQMLEMQAYNPFAITPGKLEQEIKDIELEKQLLLNHFIRLLTDTTHYRSEDAIRLLETEHNVVADKILAGTYISINEYELATDKISAIPYDKKEDQDFKALNELVLSYLEQGKSLYELNSTELEFIRELAYACPLTLSGANAQAILSMLFREEFEDCPPPMGTKTANIYDAHLNAPEDTDEFALGDNYPDPADSYTIIPYTLENENDGVLEISDASGKNFDTYKLSTNEHEFRLNTQALVPGIYNYTLINNNGKTETKKFAIYR